MTLDERLILARQDTNLARLDLIDIASAARKSDLEDWTDADYLDWRADLEAANRRFMDAVYKYRKLINDEKRK